MTAQVVYFVCIVITSIAVGQTSFCPDDCICHEIWSWGRNVYVATRQFRNMSVVPDLSPLSSISLPIYIKLSYSNLTRVTKADFPPGVRITFLNLGGNRRLVLDDDALSNIKDSLLYLDLESTRMFFNATLKFLRGLSKLETLILSFNNVYNYRVAAPYVTVSLFGGLGLSSLKKLKMYKCGIRTMSERAFQDAETIEELDLGANGLIDVPDAISAMRSLKEVDLSNSYFEVIKDRAFNENANLKTLLITNSKVKSVDSGAFKGLEFSLHTLDLRGCNLIDVPSNALKPLQVLKVLKLDKNQIKSIPAGSLSGIYCLEHLSLESMDIIFSDDMFKGQEDCIENLYLRRTQLINIPREALLILQKLHNLFLDYNLIHELTANSLIGIKASLFVLSGNPLNVISQDAFKGTSRPLFVSLDYTNISNLDFVLEYPGGTFENLDVTGLPIPCDCTTAHVVKIMEKYTLLGTCLAPETGEDFGLQTDRMYEYFSQTCPGALSAAVQIQTPKYQYNAAIVAVFLIRLFYLQ